MTPNKGFRFLIVCIVCIAMVAMAADEGFGERLRRSRSDEPPPFEDDVPF